LDETVFQCRKRIDKIYFKNIIIKLKLAKLQKGGDYLWPEVM
jgi:hypothetical protein